MEQKGPLWESLDKILPVLISPIRIALSVSFLVVYIYFEGSTLGRVLEIIVASLGCMALFLLGNMILFYLFNKSITSVVNGWVSSKNITKKVTLYGLIALQKKKETLDAIVYLSYTVTIYIIVVLFNIMPLHLSIAVLLVTLIITVFVRYIAFIYRITNGHYGTTEYEVREIARFLITHADEHYGGGGGPLKQLDRFPSAVHIGNGEITWNTTPDAVQEG